MGLLSTKPQPTPDPDEPGDHLIIPERSSVIRNALAMLRDRDIQADEVDHVTSDSILFRHAGRCKTAWMRWTGSDLIVVPESGWLAEPSSWARSQLDPKPES